MWLRTQNGELVNLNKVYSIVIIETSAEPIYYYILAGGATVADKLTKIQAGKLMADIEDVLIGDGQTIIRIAEWLKNWQGAKEDGD
jgi:hypothetical protein